MGKLKVKKKKNKDLLKRSLKGLYGKDSYGFSSIDRKGDFRAIDDAIDTTIAKYQGQRNVIRNFIEEAVGEIDEINREFISSVKDLVIEHAKNIGLPFEEYHTFYKGIICLIIDQAMDELKKSEETHDQDDDLYEADNIESFVNDYQENDEEDNE